MSSIFKDKFFSISGQKERLKNVVDTLKIAVNPFSKKKIVSNTTSKSVNKVLETVANNPYKSALVVAGSSTLLKSGAGSTALKKVSSLGSSTVKKLTGSKIIKSSSFAIAGGLAGGYLLGTSGSKGGGSTAPQTSTPTQESKQDTKTDQRQFSTINDYRKSIIKDSPYATIGSTGATLNPTQTSSQSPTLNPTQTTTQDQTAEGGSSGISPITLGIGVLFLASVLNK